jgi:predicted O-methyltransferase YrrM|tara:strand:- start:2343 stop:2975 length:633 start_codon:yes stop_codon:yes gene_type:complete
MNIKFNKYWRKTSLKKREDGDFILNHIVKFKPKNFLEVGVFHGVTSRNVCEILYNLHGNDFTFTGIDMFLNDKEILINEIAPNTKFSNPLKTIYYKYIIRTDPYSIKSVKNLLKKYLPRVNIIQGNSNEVLKKINLNEIDYVFLDGGHKYETVRNDLINLSKIVSNKGIILCDDYNLTYAPGIKQAIDEFVIQNNFKLKILNSRFAEITK